MPECTADQQFMLQTAQFLFILNCISNSPLYYLPPFRGMLGGDKAGEVKFPCSISWMTRKGIARASTLLLWTLGWALMLYAFVGDGFRFAFMLQMFATGFVTVVLTPMKGPDVALGRRDALHCYAAMIYVADHFLANQFILDVPFSSPYGAGFVATSISCGLCQFLRAEEDKTARQVYTWLGIAKRSGVSLGSFIYVLELGFMLFENLLFLVFLFGMTSGLRVSNS